MFHSENLESQRVSSDLPTAVLDSIGTLVVVTDTQGRVVYFNSACEELTGYSRTEAIARPIWEQFMMPAQMEPVESIYRSLEAGKEPEPYEATWVTGTGEQHNIHWTHATYCSASGNQYFISTGIVIEGRREVQSNRYTQAETNQNWEHQKLLLKISNYFISSDVNEIDRGIDKTLQTIAQFTDSDRAYLYQLSDSKTLNCTHYWTTPHLASQVAPLQNLLVEQIHPVYAFSSDLYFEGFKAFCDRNGTQSLLVVPLATRGQLGLVGLEVAHTEKQWQAEDINLLQIVSDILSSAIQRQQLEKERQQNYRLLEAVVNASTDAIFIKDCQGRYQLINQTAADMIGKSVAQVIGQDDRYLFPPEIAAEIQAEDREVITSGTPRVFEDQIVSRGELKFLLSSKNIYRDAQGKILGLVGVSKDITPIKQAQKDLEQANERLEQQVQERTAELSKVNQELQYHLENTPLAIVEWDQNFRVKRWSSKAEAMFGWSSAEVLGKHPSEWQFVYADDLDRVNQVIGELSQGDKFYNYCANRNTTKSGAVIECEWHNSIFYDETGKPQSVLSLVQDVTARKQAETDLKESEERLQIFIENAPSAIAMFDNQMRYLAVSKRWLADYNLQDNIIGRSHYEVFPEIPDRWRAIYQRCLAGAVEKCEEDPFIRADGTTDWVRWEIHPWYKRPQAVGGIIMFTEVITERVKVQHQLLQLNQELMRSNSELEQFAYVASHDLREPLRKIKSYTELLAQRCDRQLDEKAKKYMASIVNGSSRMQELISDLLTYSRVGRGELVFEPTDLNQVLERVLDTLRVPIQNTNATVNIEPLPTVSANPRQMEQLFQNLIANAIKFHGEAAPVIEVKAELQDRWRICVSDNGIGIDPKYAERVFAIFQRLHSRGKYEGTGIGLAICKKIIERHGEKIWLESEPGKGTAFYFTLKSV